MVHRLREQYLCVVANDGKGVVVNEDVLDNVGPEQDVTGME